MHNPLLGCAGKRQKHGAGAATTLAATQLGAGMTIPAQPRQQIFFGIGMLHFDSATIQVELQAVADVGVIIKRGSKVEQIRSWF